MKSVSATLIVDLGNSQTRVMVQSGVGRSGLVRQKLSTVSNQFAPLQEDYSLSDVYDKSNTVIFRTEQGEIFANGLLVEREYPTMAIRPTAMQTKQDSKVSVLTFIRAFYEGYKLLAEMYNCRMSALDVSWKVTYLLPPNDIEVGGKVLYDKINSISKLEYLLPDFKVDLNIENVKVFPEGFAAYIGTLMRRGRIVNEEFKYLLNATTLVVDIGAGTTDFFIIKGTETLDHTKSTTKIGGNNVIAFVRQGLIKKNITLPESVVEEGVRTGVVKDGSKVIRIEKGIAQSKDRVAYNLINEITSYFEATMFPLQTVENLLVVGGGSIPSDIEGVESLSTYLVNRLKEFSPNIELVPLPKEYRGEDSTGAETNPRLLNILGAGVLSEG